MSRAISTSAESKSGAGGQEDEDCAGLCEDTSVCAWSRSRRARRRWGRAGRRWQRERPQLTTTAAANGCIQAPRASRPPPVLPKAAVRALPSVVGTEPTHLRGGRRPGRYVKTACARPWCVREDAQRPLLFANPQPTHLLFWSHSGPPSPPTFPAASSPAHLVSNAEVEATPSLQPLSQHADHQGSNAARKLIAHCLLMGALPSRCS